MRVWSCSRAAPVRLCHANTDQRSNRGQTTGSISAATAMLRGMRLGQRPMGRSRSACRKVVAKLRLRKDPQASGYRHTMRVTAGIILRLRRLSRSNTTASVWDDTAFAPTFPYPSQRYPSWLGQRREVHAAAPRATGMCANRRSSTLPWPWTAPGLRVEFRSAPCPGALAGSEDKTTGSVLHGAVPGPAG